MQFRFGVFELDEEARELRRAGEPVRIQPKPFELLRLLLRERDRVVSFDELRAALWPETVVSPASLNRAVTHARRALADTRRGRLIRSVPRRGYRFVAAVEESDADERVRSRSPAPGAEESAARGELRPASGRSTAARAERRTADRLDGFVGREDALRRLERALGRVRQGESGLVLVRGRAGIGKTHLLAVFGRRAAERGFQVCVGRGCDGDGFPAFWPWIQVLRSLVEAPELRDEVRAYARAGNLSALTPVLREFAPDAAHDLDDAAPGALPDLSDAQQRFRFFDAARRMLLVCARTRPLLLVLEDLQWVDGGALRLLEHLSVELPGAPVLLAISVREEVREPSHRVLRTLAHLRQQPSCESIDLGGLSRGEVGELLRIAVGGPVPVDLVSELYGRTEGVPLFVGEAIRLLEERGDLDRPERIPRDGITLPARAIDLIRRSVEAISSECRALLGAAAVIGRDFPVGLATSVASLGAEEALDLVDEATRAGLIETVEHTGAITHRFTHALFQEAVYAELSSRTRARLHQSVAERLEQRHGGALDSVASELAHHHHRALPDGIGSSPASSSGGMPRPR